MAFDPFPMGYLPACDPTSLRSGVDRVRVLDHPNLKGDPLLPPVGALPRDCRGTFIGQWQGFAVIQPDALPGPHLVDPVFLDEEARLTCPTIDFYKFNDGWFTGRHQAITERGVGTLALGRKPSDFGRGVAKGYADIDAGRRFRMTSPIPYNEECRRLHRLFPEEHPEARPSKRF
jgi:hypothetical protein